MCVSSVLRACLSDGRLADKMNFRNSKKVRLGSIVSLSKLEQGNDAIEF